MAWETPRHAHTQSTPTLTYPHQHSAHSHAFVYAHLQSTHTTAHTYTQSPHMFLYVVTQPAHTLHTHTYTHPAHSRFCNSFLQLHTFSFFPKSKHFHLLFAFSQ